MTHIQTIDVGQRLAQRSAGVLLHPTSLPGPYGIGDLGLHAYAWIDALAQAGQRWWQMLPLGPTGYGDSPYQCFSAFAGNINLISPDWLKTEGLITEREREACELPPGPIEFGAVSANKANLVHQAWLAFQKKPAAELASAWEKFRHEAVFWLEDYALFRALKSQFGGGSWLYWPDPQRLRDEQALQDARRQLNDAIEEECFGQFLFDRQWVALRQYAQDRGVLLIGDMPIFIAEDSADVWAHPELFQLDADRRPTGIAGVPPDYFSETGQLWGNPLYAWEEHARTGFDWWTERVQAALRQVDLIRLDHFRGFQAYWAVPAGSTTAEPGRWVPGPGATLLATLKDRLGGLPIIAEDLGVITPDVDALRTGFDLPGMKILQFAFGGAVEERFLPHNYENPTIVYTGTHDNDTTRGWYENLTEAEQSLTHRYLNTDGQEIHWDMIRACWASVAKLAICPAQDLLNLGSSSRMNQPGRPDGNWRWRLPNTGIPERVWAKLADLTQLYQRVAAQAEHA